MISFPLWTIWRLALQILGFYLIGISVAVIYFYRRAYRIAGGAVPWHVMVVAMSYTLLVALDMYERFGRLAVDEGFRPQLIVSTAAYVLGIAALFKVLSYEHRVGRLYGRRKDDLKR